MTLAIWIAFVAYALAAVTMGWRAARRQEAGEDYWTAGRNLSGPEVGVSIAAGFMSVSWSCVYAAQLFYWYGLGAIWLITVPWLVALGGIYWLAQRYRGLDEFSQPEMVGSRFGRSARRLVAVSLAVVFLVWGGAEIYVAANLLAPGMQVDRALLIWAIGAIVGAYSVLGGFRAVVSTDKLQYGVVALYIVAIGWLALRGLATVAPDGTAEATVVPPVMAARTGADWRGLLGPGLVTIVLTFVAYLPGWLFETDLWLRVQAAATPAAARRGVAIAGLNALLFVGLLPGFIGIAALRLFPPSAGVMPPAIGNEGDAIFAALVTAYAPAWLMILVAVGLVAAAMSTIDTCVHVMGVSIGYDLDRAPARPPAAAQRRSRWITLLSVVAACVFALNTESLWDIFYLASGVLTTAVAFPVAAVFLPWATPRAVTWSSAAGLVATTGAYFMEVYGPLARIEPAWLADSGLGFVVWGVAAAALACIAGLLSERSLRTAD